MKHPTVYSLFILYGLAAAAFSPLAARPLDFNELSLLVRMHEDESSIKADIATRRLAHSLSAQQESTLKSQGASDGLVQTLRNSNLVAPKEEVAALEARDRQLNSRIQDESPVMRRHCPHVRVFNLAYGHPLNLSEWGGSDYEIAIHSYRIAGEDYIEPVMINNYRTATDVARYIHMSSESEVFNRDWYPTNEVRNFRFTPYDARLDVKDNRINFSDTIEVESHAVGRPLPVDWDSPVFIEGQPYTFYRIYGAGGVTLYYIGKATSFSAMVAIVSND